MHYNDEDISCVPFTHSPPSGKNEKAHSRLLALPLRTSNPHSIKVGRVAMLSGLTAPQGVSAINTKALV